MRSTGTMLAVLVAAVGLAVPVAFAATPEDLDETFGVDGVALHEGYEISGAPPVIDEDGQILVVGGTGSSSEIGVYRFQSNGALDSSFGNGGQVVIDHWTDASVSDATLDGEGRLVMVGRGFFGRYLWLAIRLNADGSLDESFGTGGIAEVFDGTLYEKVNSVAVDSQGRIVVGGYSGAFAGELVVARLDPSGALDPSFGEAGIAIHPQEVVFNGWGGRVALDSADRVVGAMELVTRSEESPWGPIPIYGTGTFRLTEDGDVDTSYGSGGMTVVELSLDDEITALVVDDKNRLLVLGQVSTGEIYVARFLPNGGLDVSFGDDGIFTLRAGQLGNRLNIWVSDMAPYPGNRVVVMGTSSGSEFDDDHNLLILRLTENGLLDTTFSGEGVATTDPMDDPGQSTVSSWGGGLVADDTGRIVSAFDLQLTPDPVNDPNTWTRYLGLARYNATSEGPIQAIDDPDNPPPDDPPPPDDDSGTFIDDDGHTFEADIEWLATEGITRGCNPPTNNLFCPDDLVTRGQMAAFLHRALNDVLAPSKQVDFIDDNGNTFEADIEWLGGVGVTRGCNPPTNNRYCPNEFVTRGQMAAFLVRALGYTDDGGGNLFVDDNGSVFESDIDKLGAAGVTRGCNPPTNNLFCPKDLVTRGQMAAFLHRALGS